jgi:hypothetical protein
MSAGSLRVLGLVAFGAVFLRIGAARADDPKLAEDLFDRGRQAMVQEDYGLARTQFEASYRAEPALGTLLNLAVCEEHLELWNAAIEHLAQALHDAADDDRRRASIAARLDALRARIPRLTLRSAAPMATNVVVLLDSVPVDPASFGVPLPVDPGPHAVRCQVEHDLACSHEFVAREGEPIEWWIELDSTRTATAASSAQQPAPPHALPRETRSGPSRLALWTGGLSIASLALGLVAGGEVLALKSTMAQHCDSTGCDAAGVSAAAAGKTWSWVSTVATGIGALGLGTSIAIALTARPSQGAHAEVAVRGQF